MAAILLFYVPIRNETEASSLGEMVIDHGLAACANIFPIQSLYEWAQELKHDQEHVLVLKTLPSHEQALEKFIQHNHSYELPAILRWEVRVNPEYQEWVSSKLTVLSSSN